MVIKMIDSNIYIKIDIDKVKVLRKLSRIIGLPVINEFLTLIVRDKNKKMLIRGCKFIKKFGKAEYPLYLGDNVKIYGIKNIKIGRNVVIYDHVYLDANRFIEIGDDTHIDVFTSIYGHGGVKIGKMCAIAAGVRIYSQTNQYNINPKLPIIKQPRKYGRVIIGDDVWIGANAVILPGVKIGSHSIIGAGAVVTKDIPKYSVAVGIPAKVIKRRCLD